MATKKYSQGVIRYTEGDCKNCELEGQMKHQGRGIIRLNDRTDHGGQVISASSGTMVLGRQAAIHGDTTYCPACKGTFAIRPDGAGAKHEGNPYAYEGDVTECGAKLISSVA